ncbi:MAG: TIGR02757 family protein [Balneolaceae bacterium]
MLRKRSYALLLELKPHLDRLQKAVEKPSFIDDDPVQFMHAFADKRDREIAGFFAALFAWGRRDIVINKTDDLLRRMDYRPYDCVMNYSVRDRDLFSGFRHRTFKPADIDTYMRAMKQVYRTHPDFENYWETLHHNGDGSIARLLSDFKRSFTSLADPFPARAAKHISDPLGGSTAKRMAMYLRWCSRQNSPVDPGIWTFFPTSRLVVPFDVHVARQARRYGLLARKTNDWRAVEELQKSLLLLDSDDPSRYDYALFALGAMEYELPPRFLLNRVR